MMKLGLCASISVPTRTHKLVIQWKRELIVCIEKVCVHKFCFKYYNLYCILLQNLCVSRSDKCISPTAPVGLVPRSNVRLNQRVKFSLDEAPSDEECHSLLTNYMPDFIQKTKITQRLFIK